MTVWSDALSRSETDHCCSWFIGKSGPVASSDHKEPGGEVLAYASKTTSGNYLVKSIMTPILRWLKSPRGMWVSGVVGSRSLRDTKDEDCFSKFCFLSMLSSSQTSCSLLVTPRSCQSLLRAQQFQQKKSMKQLGSCFSWLVLWPGEWTALAASSGSLRRFLAGQVTVHSSVQSLS